ncbi:MULTISPECIES: response regulator [Niastella]|uniref:Response regulator n=1 Tax=Niastella soli TaxID=2821487 RepID=A0ABS3YY96_9BACT|nr:response regulator [Niastella soli]MBO9202848.1 response regulator [Niastella soli]
MKEEKVIMLIDDDMDDRFLFSRAAKLKKPEITCVTADGGKEALELLDKMPQLPQVIFLDINMPGMNGWEFLSQFKKNDHFKNIPILIYSTSSNEKDITTAETAGASGYCVKPLDFDGLHTILNFVSANLGPHLPEAIKDNNNITYFKHPGNQH